MYFSNMHTLIFLDFSYYLLTVCPVGTQCMLIMPVLSKKGIIKSFWVNLLCLVFLGLGEPPCFHLELCLLVSVHISRSSFHRIAFFPSLKHNFIAYRFSKDLIAFLKFTSCDGQSSHNMYSNNIVNFQVSTTILNACTKKSGNVLKAPRTIFSSI